MLLDTLDIKNMSIEKLAELNREDNNIYQEAIKKGLISKEKQKQVGEAYPDLFGDKKKAPEVKGVLKDFLLNIKDDKGVSGEAYDAWFEERVTNISIENDTAIIEVPDKFPREWIETKYGDIVKKVLAKTYGKKLSIKYVSRKYRRSIRLHKYEKWWWNCWKWC